LCDGVRICSFGLTVSRVGFSVFSIQVNIVWVSTDFELRTRLATLAYDFCTDESFAAETNRRAYGYDIFFSDLTFWISFSLRKYWQSFDEAMWGCPQLEHFGWLLQSKPSWSSSEHLKHRIGFGTYGLTLTL
jgi:hypothetical protein